MRKALGFSLSRVLTLIAVLFTGVGLQGAAFADLITNGNFEAPTTPAVPPGDSYQFFTGSSFPGWDVVGVGGVELISGPFSSFGFKFPAEDGNFWLDLTGYVSNSATGIQQTVATWVGTVYDLSFWVGNQFNPGGLWGTSSTVEVFVGGVSQGSFTNTGGAGTNIQNWQQFILGFTASSTSTPIKFLNKDFADNTNGLDNVELLAEGSPPPPSLPEPSTLSLLGQGLVAFVVARRRKAD